MSRARIVHLTVDGEWRLACGLAKARRVRTSTLALVTCDHCIDAENQRVAAAMAESRQNLTPARSASESRRTP